MEKPIPEKYELNMSNMRNTPFTTWDLTHELSEVSPSWNGSCGFQQEIKLDYAQCTSEVKFRVQQIKMHAGIGTHMDAPSHCVPGGHSIHELDVNHFIAPCIVVDVSSKSHELYTASVEDILDFETAYGKIPKGSFVIIRTGWERFWNNSEKYRNSYRFPSISADVAAFLLERHIVGLGIDTLSPDRPESGYPVHHTILGADKYIIENVANSGKIPPRGSYSFALPIKAKGCTEAPIRLIAIFSESLP
jgi:kynurenine formamidase